MTVAAKSWGSTKRLETSKPLFSSKGNSWQFPPHSRYPIACWLRHSATQDSEKGRNIGVVGEQVRVAKWGAIFGIGVNDYDGDAVQSRVLVKARHQVLKGWHFLFRQNQVDRLQLREPERFCIIARFNDAVSLTLDRFPHAGTYPLYVLDDEDRRNLPKIFH